MSVRRSPGLAVLFGLVAITGTGIGADESKSSGALDSSCAVTSPVIEQPPTDPSADPFIGRWFANEDRTIWAGWDAVQLRPGGNKVLWIRPKGTQLEVTGRRLDGPSRPVKAVISCCYPSGFQASGVYVPTAGCWEIVGKAGKSELRFVTNVTARSQAKKSEHAEKGC